MSIELLKLLVKEGKRRVLLLASILSVVALVALVVAVAIPKRYVASTLLVVESAAIRPLIEGHSSSSATNEQAAITLQVMEGNKIPRELLLFGEWVEPPPAKQPEPREEARLVAQLRSRIKVDSPKEGMIRIAFSDSDPDRTYKVANKLAEIYIRESSEQHKRESKEAFEFIDKQVKEYAEKLATYHQQVLAHHRREEIPLGTPDQKPAIAPRQVPSANKEAELASLQAEKATLQVQLASKPSTAAVDTRQQEVLRARVLQLQTDLDKLQATYTDQHPDVKRLKRELAAAKDELRAVEDAVAAQKNDAQNAAALDADLRRAAQVRLDEVNKRIATLTNTPAPPSVLTTHPRAPVAAPTTSADPELRGIGTDTTLAELLRRYEATRDVYQDLLKRRESARVAMQLAEQRGSSLRVQEPAERPITATGLRVSHYCAIGLILALLVPVGVLFAIVRLDPRVRSARQIEMLARVPLLVSITPGVDRMKARQRLHRVLAVLMIFGVFVAYVMTFIIKTRA